MLCDAVGYVTAKVILEVARSRSWDSGFPSIMGLLPLFERASLIAEGSDSRVISDSRAPSLDSKLDKGLNAHDGFFFCVERFDTELGHLVFFGPSNLVDLHTPRYIAR